MRDEDGDSDAEKEREAEKSVRLSVLRVFWAALTADSCCLISRMGRRRGYTRRGGGVSESGGGGWVRRWWVSRWTWERRMRRVMAIESGMVESDWVWAWSCSSSPMGIRSISTSEFSSSGKRMAFPTTRTPWLIRWRTSRSISCKSSSSKRLLRAWVNCSVSGRSAL